MTRKWLLVVLAVGPRLEAASLEVTTTPPGAAVRWTAPDSPVVHTAGPAPCRLTVPDRAGEGACTVLCDAPGYLPAARSVTVAALRAGPVTLAVPLRRYALSLLPALAEASRLAKRPPTARASKADDADDDERDEGRYDRSVPAGDGAGIYQMHTFETEGQEGFELWWLPFGGEARRLVSDRGARPKAMHFRVPDLTASPDGQWLAWSGSQRRAEVIRVRHRSLPLERSFKAAGGGDIDYPVWSPDGQHLAYRSEPRRAKPARRHDDEDDEDDGPSPRDRYDAALYLHPWAGGGDRLVLRGVGPRFAFSPDGRQLALERREGLALLDLADGQVRTIAPGASLEDEPEAIRWSPDGRWLACRLLAAEGRRRRGPDRPGEDLTLIPAGGGTPRVVCQTIGSVSWLPDSGGLYVAAIAPWPVGFARGLRQLAVGLDGRLLAALGDPVPVFERLSWAPDSRSLVTVALLGERRRVALRLDLDGWTTTLSAALPGEVWEAVDTTTGLYCLVGPPGGWPNLGPAALWRLSGDQCERLLDGLDAPRSLTAAADGTALAMLTGPLDDAKLVRYGHRPPHVTVVTGLPGPLEAVALSPDGRVLAAGTTDRKCYLLPAARGLARFDEPQAEAVAPQWLPDGSGVRPYPTAPQVLLVTGRTAAAQGLNAVYYGRNAVDRQPVAAWRSPDGRWLAALDHGRVLLAAATDVEHAKPLDKYHGPEHLEHLVPARELP